MTGVGYCPTCGFVVDTITPRRRKTAVLDVHVRGGRDCPGSLQVPSVAPMEDERFALRTTPPAGAQCGYCGGSGIELIQPEGVMKQHYVKGMQHMCSGTHRKPLSPGA